LRDVIVAGRYAKALFIITERRGETERALEDLKGLAGVLEPGGRVGSFLASPQVRLPDKRDVLRRGFEGKVLRTVIVFVDLLLRKRRLAGFPVIVEEFEALVESALGIKRAHVVSAVPLLAEESRELHRNLEQFTRSRIKLSSEVDPSLLGGALVRIGDRVVDRSVRTLLEAIEHQLQEVSV
jgi:F-type H+-transporting ATPase subunit delta